MNIDAESSADDAEERKELLGNEGGRWSVETQGSEHLFDLDAFTVTRVPGAMSKPGVNDRTRPIRTIEACKVGSSGFWTMHPEDQLTIEYFWQVTSRIRRIVRSPGGLGTAMFDASTATTSKDEAEGRTDG